MPEIQINKLAEFLGNLIGVEVEIRNEIFSFFNADRKIAYLLAGCRILDLYSPFEKYQPTQEEVSFEEKSFADSSLVNNITLYDGFELQKILKTIIPESELAMDKLHLAFTSRLTCTYDYDDYKYHGRTVICSNPSIISTNGIIEAPAKPREYYLELYENMSRGLNVDNIQNKFKGRFLEYHDERLSLVVRGYALQAIFYYFTGNPFCESKNCMLYNAHWQEDLLHSQIEVGKICDQHQKILDDFSIKSE